MSTTTDVAVNDAGPDPASVIHEAPEVALLRGIDADEYGMSIGPVAAAVILGDKSDVHRSRVRDRADTAADGAEARTEGGTR